MITNKDINEEILKVEKQVEDKLIKDVGTIGILKMLALQLKLEMCMRTNQTLMMDKLGVKKIEPTIRREDEKTK